MRLKSPASRLFTQSFIQMQLKENIKAPRHWPLCGEFIGKFPAQKASHAEDVSIWWRHHVFSVIPLALWKSHIEEIVYGCPNAGEVTKVGITPQWRQDESDGFSIHRASIVCSAV